jgi:hypothetical protein
MEREAQWLLPLFLRRIELNIKLHPPADAHPEKLLQSLTQLRHSIDKFYSNPKTSEEEKRISFAERALIELEDRERFFYTGALANLIGSAELVIQRLAIKQFLSHPDQAPPSKEHPFTYAELATFNDIDAAREFLLEKPIREKMYGDFAPVASSTRLRFNPTGSRPLSVRTGRVRI